MNILSDRKNLRLLWIIPGLLALGIAAYLIATKIVNSIDYHNNDFFTFWLAGHLVAQGGDPYSPTQWVAGHQQYGVTWIPNQAYVYPLPLSLLFYPLGMLSLYQGFIVWVALSIIMILASLALLIQAEARLTRLVIALLVGIIFFRPTILTLFHGQISAWMLLILCASLFLWEKGHWEWGSLLLPLLMLKPNLGAPLLILLGAWLLFQKRNKSIIAMALMGLFLLAVGFLQNPEWVSIYWRIGNIKVAGIFGSSPTIWGLGNLICPDGSACMPIFGGFAGILLLLMFGWLVLRHPEWSAFKVMALAVTVTLLITPYTWTYDQLLLIIPISALMFVMDRPGLGFFISASLFIFIDLLTVVLLLFDSLMNFEKLNVIIPLLVLGLCAWLFQGSQTDRSKAKLPKEASSL